MLEASLLYVVTNLSQHLPLCILVALSSKQSPGESVQMTCQSFCCSYTQKGCTLAQLDTSSYADPESFVREGSTLTGFLRGGSKYHYKRAIIGPPAKRHLIVVTLAGRCWPNNESWLGSFEFFSGSGPILQRNPIFLKFSGEWVSRPRPPPLWRIHACVMRLLEAFAHMLSVQKYHVLAQIF